MQSCEVLEVIGRRAPADERAMPSQREGGALPWHLGRLPDETYRGFVGGRSLRELMMYRLCFMHSKLRLL